MHRALSGSFRSPLQPCSRTYSYARALEASEYVSLATGKSYLLVKPGVTGLVTWTTLFYSLDRLLLMVHTHACSVAQSCPTLCDPMDCRSRCSSVHGILQARILQWVAVLSSRGSSQSGDLLNPGIKPTSSTLQADSLPLNHRGSLRVATYWTLKS